MIRENPKHMTPKNILVPVDFSVGSEQALDYACALAGKLGATVHLVNVLGVGDIGYSVPAERLEELTVEHRRWIEALADSRRPVATMASPHVSYGEAREAILDFASTIDADLIVMGTHGRRGLSRLVLGSVTENVLREAACPVIAVRTKAGAA